MARFDTHICSGPVPYLFVSVFQGLEVTTGALVAAGIGSILSDVDSERSIIGSSIPIVKWCRKYGIHVEHQGFFHSLAFLIGAGILASPLLLLGWDEVYVAFLLGILSHHILDSIISDPSNESVKGIKWLFPLEDKFIFSSNFIFDYGSKQEAVLKWIMLSLTLAFLFINHLGIRIVLNQHFADVKAAIELIDMWNGHYTLKAEVSAKHKISNEPVNGIFNVEGVDKNFVILRSGKTLLSIGDGYETEATLRAESIHILKDKPIKIEVHEINLSRQPLNNLWKYIEPGKNYRLFSEKLILKDDVAIPMSSLAYNAAESSGKNIMMHLATLEDIESIKNALVAEGRVTVKYWLEPGEKVRIAEVLPSEIQEIEIGYLAEVLININEFINKDDTIATDLEAVKEIELKESLQNHLKKEINTIQQTYKEKQKYYAAEKEALSARLEHAKKEAKIDSILLTKDLVSRMDAEAKKLTVKSIQSNLEKQKADEIIERILAENQIEKLLIDLAQTGFDILKLKKKAYIKSRYTGMVKDIYFVHSFNKITARIYIQPLKVDNGNN